MSIATNEMSSFLTRATFYAHWKPIITYLQVQKQNDGYNCGLFAISFAADLMGGAFPMDACFDVRKMRSHLIYCLESKILTPFTKASR